MRTEREIKDMVELMQKRREGYTLDFAISASSISIDTLLWVLEQETNIDLIYAHMKAKNAVSN